MSEVETWSPVAASNSSAPPDGAPETTMTPAQVNDTLRELMASVRRWYDNPEFLNLSVGHVVARVSTVSVSIAGIDQTAIFTDGLRVRLDGGASPQYGFVASSSFATDTTIVLAMDGAASVDAATDEIRAHIARTARSGAFREVGTDPGDVVDVESALILAARSRAPWKKTSSDQSITATATTLITQDGVTNYAALTAADGAKDFDLYAMFQIEQVGSAGAVCTLQVRVGASGGTADALVYEWPLPRLNAAGDQDLVPIVAFRIVNPASGARVSFSLAKTSGASTEGWKILGSGTTAARFSYAVAEEEK